VLYADGKRFHLLGINWYGSESTIQMPEGLGYRPIGEYIDFLANHRFNALRLLFNAEDWRANPVVAFGSDWRLNEALNPEFAGATYREMLQLVVRAAAKRRIVVLLALHRLRRDYGGWPGSWDGLWYEHAEGGLSEATVMDLWREVATTFCSEWNVFAADLMNEPHSGLWGSSGWNSTEWSAEHDESFPWSAEEVDWQQGAARLGNAVLEKCPRLLIFVEGTGEYGTEWGQSFHGLLRLSLMSPPGPVNLTNQSKLVLSPHTYGPSLYAPEPLHIWFPSRFKDPTFPANMRAYWDAMFGFIPSHGVPMVVGEFGGSMSCCNLPGLLTNEDADASYQREAVAYLVERGAGFFYFCLNPSSHDTGGVLEGDWRTPVARKIALFKHVPATVIRWLEPPSPPSPPPTASLSSWLPSLRLEPQAAAALLRHG
jgi:endoglucanase